MTPSKTYRAARAATALAFGVASPCPHPPSRSWAMTGPAHLPELNPQHPSAQSASEAQTPVMNCVPVDVEDVAVVVAEAMMLVALELLVSHFFSLSVI